MHSFFWLYLTINAANFQLILLDRNTYGMFLLVILDNRGACNFVISQISGWSILNNFCRTAIVMVDSPPYTPCNFSSLQKCFHVLPNVWGQAEVALWNINKSRWKGAQCKKHEQSWTTVQHGWWYHYRVYAFNQPERNNNWFNSHVGGQVWDKLST